MTPDEAVRAVADRLRAVDWERHGYRSRSRGSLMQEYFRRMALWTAAYGCATHTPFYDLAQCIDPAVRADPAVVDEVVQAIKAASTMSRDVTDVTPFILHWAALRATPEADLPEDLDDPFEPLLLLFERDGGFHIEKGFVELEYVAVPMFKWREKAGRPPADLSPAALDELDRAWSLKQFGHVMTKED
ncbi:hypothetical protein [Actinoplanes sp. DH11]|uniref:hypothetical protein n=1 Tax=Actinoplanes sp. DH11 TaxID=2857011 RepID=UPI001E3873EE|nr:hypothetical protein [Actinoplanes sp. DH11]